jgi:hypothetical protein
MAASVTAGRVTPEALDRPAGTVELVAGGPEDREGFVVCDRDDADQPAAQLGQGGFPTDPVKDYLRQIGKVIRPGTNWRRPLSHQDVRSGEADPGRSRAPRTS